MEKIITGHPEVLTHEAKQVISKLSYVIPQTFYMAGGTCLALQLGHRISIDFDFFTQEEFSENSRTQLINKLKNLGSFEIIENKEGTLHARLNNVQLSFFYYPYKLLKPTVSWQKIRLAQLEDIAPMKLNAIIGRGSKKDFIDLFMISKKIRLKKIFALCVKKFSNYPSFYLQAARALVFFNDADREPMPKMLINLNWDDIKLFFETEIKKIMNALLQKINKKKMTVFKKRWIPS